MTISDEIIILEVETGDFKKISELDSEGDSTEAGEAKAFSSVLSEHADLVWGDDG